MEDEIFNGGFSPIDEITQTDGLINLLADNHTDLVHVVDVDSIPQPITDVTSQDPLSIVTTPISDYGPLGPEDVSQLDIIHPEPGIEPSGDVQTTFLGNGCSAGCAGTCEGNCHDVCANNCSECCKSSYTS